MVSTKRGVAFDRRTFCDVDIGLVCLVAGSRIGCGQPWTRAATLTTVGIENCAVCVSNLGVPDGQFDTGRQSCDPQRAKSGPVLSEIEGPAPVSPPDPTGRPALCYPNRWGREQTEQPGQLVRLAVSLCRMPDWGQLEMRLVPALLLPSGIVLLA